MAIKKVGARFSNAEYLEAGFDFVEGSGSVSIVTPEGIEDYAIGSSGGGGGGDTLPLEYINVDLVLGTDNYLFFPNEEAWNGVESAWSAGKLVLVSYNSVTLPLGYDYDDNDQRFIFVIRKNGYISPGERYGLSPVAFRTE